MYNADRDTISRAPPSAQSLQLCDHPFNHAEAALPEGRVAGVEAEGLEQLGVTGFRAATRFADAGMVSFVGGRNRAMKRGPGRIIEWRPPTYGARIAADQFTVPAHRGASEAPDLTPP
jgi:hypothetical protein